MSTTPLEKVPAHVLALAARINEATTYDADGAGVLPEEFVETVVLAGHDISLETIKKVQDIELDFGDALVLANGDKGHAHIPQHKGLERTTLSARFGNDELKASYDAKIMVRAPGATEEKPKYGVGNLKLVSGIGQKRGNLKRIQDHLVAAATESGVFAK